MTDVDIAKRTIREKAKLLIQAAPTEEAAGEIANTLHEEIERAHSMCVDAFRQPGRKWEPKASRKKREKAAEEAQTKAERDAAKARAAKAADEAARAAELARSLGVELEAPAADEGEDAVDPIDEVQS
jgi:hypothetical protein